MCGKLSHSRKPLPNSPKLADEKNLIDQKINLINARFSYCILQNNPPINLLYPTKQPIYQLINRDLTTVYTYDNWFVILLSLVYFGDWVTKMQHFSPLKTRNSAQLKTVGMSYGTFKVTIKWIDKRSLKHM